MCTAGQREQISLFLSVFPFHWFKIELVKDRRTDGLTFKSVTVPSLPGLLFLLSKETYLKNVVVFFRFFLRRKGIRRGKEKGIEKGIEKGFLLRKSGSIVHQFPFMTLVKRKASFFSTAFFYFRLCCAFFFVRVFFVLNQTRSIASPPPDVSLYVRL